MDLSTFDFRTGKMLMSKVNRSRQRVRYDSASQAKGKPDLNTALPVRQTASIFKQPVTKITNHPSNKVKSDPQKAVEQPRQVSRTAPGRVLVDSRAAGDLCVCPHALDHASPHTVPRVPRSRLRA